MGYLAFPLNVRYGLGAGPAEAYVFAGATFGALLTADQKRESPGGDVDTDVKSALAGFLVTVDLGGGIGYRLNDRLSAGADVRYSLGVTDVAKSDPALAVKSWHTNGLQLIVGISYRFGAVTPAPDRTSNYARN
jgi:opacity protein-like surface antigen